MGTTGSVRETSHLAFTRGVISEVTDTSKHEEVLAGFNEISEG